MSNNQNLQTILRESLRAYEQARAAHLRSQQAADAAFTRTTAELTAAEQTERARLEAEHRARRATAAGEQARLGDLAAAVTSLEEAARTTLAQAGLAHIAGAPAAVDDPPAKARRGDAEVTQLFVQAQTGYVALREAILKLAQAQVAAGQWDAARQTLKPLLAEKEGPLFEAAFALQRASYVHQASKHIKTNGWRKALRCLLDYVENISKADREVLDAITATLNDTSNSAELQSLTSTDYASLRSAGCLTISCDSSYPYVVRWYHNVGERVGRGEPIVKTRDTSEPYYYSEVSSPDDGIIIAIFVHEKRNSNYGDLALIWPDM